MARLVSVIAPLVGDALVGDGGKRNLFKKKSQSYYVCVLYNNLPHAFACMCRARRGSTPLYFCGMLHPAATSLDDGPSRLRMPDSFASTHDPFPATYTPYRPIGARLSSTIGGNNGFHCGAEKCIDGVSNRDTWHSSHSCVAGSTMCVSGFQTGPWLSVDLGGYRAVAAVVLHNRIDCCRERLGRYQLFVSALPVGAAGPILAGPHSWRPFLCNEGVAVANSLILLNPCIVAGTNAARFGRYVTLFLPGENRTLQIEELEATGELRGPPPPPMPPIVYSQLRHQHITPVGARLSSQFNRWCPAVNCVNGDHSAAHSKHGCEEGSTLCHSATSTTSPWLEIDLGQRQPIGRVIVFNRADCCYERLGVYEILTR